MRVRIDKTRCGGMPVEVDDAKAGTIPCKIQDFAVRANFHDGTVPYRYSLRDRIFFIYGQDMAMNHHKVGVRGLRKRNLCHQQHAHQGACRSEFVFEWHGRMLSTNACNNPSIVLGDWPFY